MVLGLLLTGCEQTLQIMGPILEEPEMMEPGILEPETPVTNTGDCISQVDRLQVKVAKDRYKSVWRGKMMKTCLIQITNI